MSDSCWCPYPKDGKFGFAPDKENEKYLCCSEDGDMAVGTYTSFGWMFGHYFPVPRWWMPLPPVPKESEEV